MQRHLPAVAAIALGIAISVLGCTDPRRTAGPQGVLSRVQGHARHIERPPEDKVAQQGKNIPGFGGFTFGSAGNMIVFLTDLSQEVRARSELAAVLATGPRQVRHGWPGHPASSPQSKAPTIEIRKANYTFEELRTWRDKIDGPLLSTHGVVMLGVDIKKNVIFVAVDGSAYESLQLSVERILDEAGVPHQAVRIDHSSTIREDVRISNLAGSDSSVAGCNSWGDHTNTDYKRPLIGGLMICWADSNNLSRACTLGFITTYMGDPAFVTASHCSKIQGGLDSTVYGQPDASTQANEIGYEVFDPSFTQDSGCTSMCRWSDASIVKLDSTSGVLGSVARPGNCGLPYNCDWSHYNWIGESPRVSES